MCEDPELTNLIESTERIKGRLEKEKDMKPRLREYLEKLVERSEKGISERTPKKPTL